MFEKSTRSQTNLLQTFATSTDFGTAGVLIKIRRFARGALKVGRKTGLPEPVSDFLLGTESFKKLNAGKAVRGHLGPPFYI